MNLPNLSLMEGMDFLGKEVDKLRETVKGYKIALVVVLVATIVLGFVSINQSKRISELELNIIGLASSAQFRGDALQEMIEKRDNDQSTRADQFAQMIDGLTSSVEHYRDENEKRDLMLWKAVKAKK